jgi:hypothetical protein
MTKRIPGAKRGRPAKPKPLKACASRGRGRPRVPLHLHPRRYEIALFDAWSYLMGSERLAATFVVRDDLQWGVPTPGEFNEAADNLRKLAKSRVSPADLEWRTAMGEAVCISFVPGADPRLKVRLILRRAAAVNETEFAVTAMLPEMLDTDLNGTARFLAELYSHDDQGLPELPELTPHFSPKTI